MKTLTFISVSLGLACLAGAASAQEVILEQTEVVDPTVAVGSMTPTPEAPAIARKEAAAAWAQAQRDCRRERSHDAQQSCLADARSDYRQMTAAAAHPSPAAAHAN